MEADDVRFFGALSGIELGAAPASTVGEVRAVLRARSLSVAAAAADGVPDSSLARPADGWAQELICVGGRQLPADDGVLLEGLELDPDGEVGARPRRCEGDVCCPAATLRGEAEPEPVVEKKLSVGERFLSAWLLLAAGLGVGLGQVPGMDGFVGHFQVGRANMLTAVGMVAMLLPPFASVRYLELPQNLRRMPKRIGVASVLTNWLVGPLAMLGLGCLVLRSHSEILQGVIFVGAARCIAMVLLWNGFAGGDQLLCVSLVLLNSIITIGAYAPVVSVLGVVARAVGVDLAGAVSFWTVLQNVLVYLGIPLALGVVLWLGLHRKDCYESSVLPALSHLGLLALLWTVMWMFAEMSGPLIAGQFPLGEVLLALIPLILYFAGMFTTTWAFSRYVLRVSREQTITLAFTAASNNFELALAATAGIYGADSLQAVTTILGPMVEIPVMLLMVKAAQYLP